MVFETGKFYQHSTGEKISILCETNTTFYGDNVLIAESDKSPFLKPLGKSADYFVNWHEITKEEWEESFS